MSIAGPAIRATPHRLDCDAGAMTAAAAPAIGRRDGRFLQPPQGGWTFVGFAWIWGLGILLPLAGLVVFSFVSTKGVQFVFEPTLRAYYEIFAYSGWAVIQRSLRIAATMTFLELAIAFPFAVWLAKGARSPRVKLVIFSLLVVPFFLSPASRTIVWRVVLGREGPVNSLIMALGIVDEPVDWLLFSEPAVHFGFIGPYFPSMVWPILPGDSHGVSRVKDVLNAKTSVVRAARADLLIERPEE